MTNHAGFVLGRISIITALVYAITGTGETV